MKCRTQVLSFFEFFESSLMCQLLTEATLPANNFHIFTKTQSQTHFYLNMMKTYCFWDCIVVSKRRFA